MSFNEKLQYLRKENKLSQEQLADMLDVTRQSVSKWESGTTYPEMDKLIMLCKIFKCSLDDLTNDEITDIKELNKKNTSNNMMSNLLNNFLEIINKTVKMFQAMSFKQVVGCIVSLLFLGLFLIVLRIPFDMLESGIFSVIRGLGNSNFTNVLVGLFNLIIDIIYFALYVLVFVYIYKIAYLDKYEFVGTQKKTDVENNPADVKKVYEEKEVIQEETVKVSKSEPLKENTLFKILGGLVIGFVKFLVAFMAIPGVCILMLLCFFLVLSIYLITEGINFFGLILGLIFGIVLAIWFLELLSIFIFNRKASFRRLLWTFIVSVIGLSMSGGFFVLELSKIEFVDEMPPSLDLVSKDYVYDMRDDFALDSNFVYGWYHSSYEVDESLGDKVKIQIESYDEFTNVGVVEDSDSYSIVYYDYYNGTSQTHKVFEMVKNNLKDNKVYNYSRLGSVKVKVIASKKNIDIIKENSKKLTEKRREYELKFSCDYDSYEVRISDYEDELDRLREENDELSSKVEELEQYKERVKDILGE